MVIGNVYYMRVLYVTGQLKLPYKSKASIRGEPNILLYAIQIQLIPSIQISIFCSLNTND